MVIIQERPALSHHPAGPSTGHHSGGSLPNQVLKSLHSYQACVYFLACITLSIQESMALYQDDGSLLFQDDGPSSSQDGGTTSFQGRFNPSLQDECSSEDEEVEKVI